MKRLTTSRAAWLTTAVMVGVLAGGGGFALASGSSNTVKACVHHGTHVLYTGKCKSGDRRISWNKTGPTGAPGTPATKLFAAVNANGTFSASQSKRVVSVSQPFGTGSYEVDFNQNVRNCAYIAGGGEAGSGASGSPAFYNATGRSTTVDGVFLDTYSSSGSPANESFYLAVLC